MIWKDRCRDGPGDPVVTIYAWMMRDTSLLTSTFQRRRSSVSCRPSRHSLSLPLLSYGQLTFRHVPKVRVSTGKPHRSERARRIEPCCRSALLLLVPAISALQLDQPTTQIRTQSPTTVTWTTASGDPATFDLCKSPFRLDPSWREVW